MKLIGDQIFKLHAQHFYNLGLNICVVSNTQNENNFLEPNLLKAPANVYKHLFENKQSSEEFNELDFDGVVGIGLILGHENVMAIDVDGCVDFDLINLICKELDIPLDYQWIVKSGSLSGFHIILKCSNRPASKDNFGYNSVDSFYPNPLHYVPEIASLLPSHYNYDLKRVSSFFKNNYTLKYLFQKIEFGWKGFLVIPPSIHSSGSNYEFVNGVPLTEPMEMDFNKIKALRDFIGSKEKSFATIETTLGGMLNNSINDYIDNVDIEFIFFDTIINGLPSELSSDSSLPNLLQLSWLVVNKNFSLLRKEDFLIDINDVILDSKAQNIHGITSDKLSTIGYPIKFVLKKFLSDIEKCKGKIISHNFEFDSNVLKNELSKNGMNTKIFTNKPNSCSMMEYIYGLPLHKVLQTPRPSLDELYFLLFKRELPCYPNAIFNALVCKICYEKLVTPIGDDEDAELMYAQLD